jgi:TatD DNase family protein
MQERAKPRWVDFHCHLDLYPNHVEVLRACEDSAVATLAVTTTPKAWSRNCEVAKGAKYVRVALGLHPQLVSERASEITEFERYLSNARYVGEVGLDAGPRYFKSLPLQKEIFREVLRLCATQGGKILTLHSVRSVGDVLNMLESELPVNRGRAVLHWFTGTKAQARRAVELGCYFSINRQMLLKADHRTLVGTLPVDRLLTETDGPFVKVRKRAILPTDIPDTVAELAAVRKMSQGEMTRLVLGNLRTLVME